MADVAGKTFGEFFDLVMAWAQGPDGSAEAHVALRDWSETDSGVSWEDARAIPVSVEIIVPLAEDMQTEFKDILRGTSGDELYTSRVQRGHSLLRAIARIAREQGIALTDEQLDASLTATETVAAMQWAARHV